MRHPYFYGCLIPSHLLCLSCPKSCPMPKPGTDPAVIGFLTVRKLIGFLGFTFPFLLVGGSFIGSSCRSLEFSISHYYYSSMSDWFVGVLFAVALFLYSYKGYGRVDNWASNVASLSAIVIAVCPTYCAEGEMYCPALQPATGKVIGIIHFIAAALFFLTLAFMSLFLFTQTSGQPTPRKKLRNLIYRICGILIIASIILMIPLATHLIPALDAPAFRFRIIFWLEVVALCAFGFSWLVKGETVLQDRQE